MAAGDIKKPHVDVDPREYSPGTMRTRAVLPGEILVDGDGNPIGGGSIIVISTDADAALSATEALAEDLRNEIAQAAQDAFDGAVALIEAAHTVPPPVDPEEDTALAAIEALEARLQERVGQAAQDAFDGAVALIDQLRLECKNDVDPEEDTALSSIEALSAAMNEKIAQAAQDAFDGAVALFDQLKNRLDALDCCYDWVGPLETLHDKLQQAAQDAFDGAVALIDIDRAAWQAAVAAARAEAQALVDSAAAGLRDELQQAAQDAFDGAVDLIEQIDCDDAEALVDAAAAALRDDIQQVAGDADEAITEAEARILQTLRRTYLLTTPDAVPAIIATLSPGAIRTMRIFAKIIGFRQDLLQAAGYNIVALARAIPASDVLTFAGAPLTIPSDGETVTLDAVVYTWRAAPVAAYDVNIGADTQGSLDNLVAAITLTGTPGVDYGPGTAIHPTVHAVKDTASTMEAIAKFTGVAGNAIVATETMANGSFAGGGTLVGGTDMSVLSPVVTPEHEDDPVWHAAIAAVGANVEISVIGAALTTIKWKAEIETVELF